MQDRYLYRAKHIHVLPCNEHLDGTWVIGYLSGEHYISNEDGEHLIDPATICQFTGRTDEDKKLIFEHDIVSYLDTYSTENGYAESCCVGKVVWDDETLSFQVTERLSAESYEVLDGCKVIGNIFDNPELLE